MRIAEANAQSGLQTENLAWLGRLGQFEQLALHGSKGRCAMPPEMSNHALGGQLDLGNFGAEVIPPANSAAT